MKYKFIIPTILTLLLLGGVVIAQSLWYPDDSDNLTPVDDTWGSTINGDLTVDTDTLYVDSISNRVGIGTNSPDRLLDLVAGEINFDNLYGIRLEDADGTSRAVLTKDASNNVLLHNYTGDLSLKTNNTDRLYIENTGNIGINTTGPDRKLDILDASNPQARFTHTDGSAYADLQVDSNGDLLIDPTGDIYTLDN